jgi:hypothetical protein
MIRFLIVALIVLALVSPSLADEPKRSGIWLEKYDEAEKTTDATTDFVIHPQAEMRPALKLRFIPSDFDLIEGNSAIFYLKALGFLEQSYAREQVREAYEKGRKLATEKGVNQDQVAPEVWKNMLPGQLPLEEVKSFLELTRFQQPLIAEAARRTTFSLDRNIRGVENPIGYLLPEIQEMRQLSRLQSLRCRVAIAENDIDAAIAIIGQQFALARHLNDDEFIVSNLVGAAIASMAWQDLLMVIQHPKAPNLYWALAAMPHPFISMRRGFAYEREFLFEQIKVLREVDEKLRPEGYWSDFVARLVPQIQGLSVEDVGFGVFGGEKPDVNSVASYIKRAHPVAQQYLTDECKMDRGLVDSYPAAQAVFLAIRRYYEMARDDYFKLTLLNETQSSGGLQQSIERRVQDTDKRYEAIAQPSTAMLPGIQNIIKVHRRIQQLIALAQTIESIRDYTANNEGKLPASLSDLVLPAPLDSCSGKPFEYTLNGNEANLVGTRVTGIRYKFTLKSKP